MDCSLDDQDRLRFNLSKPVTVVYNGKNMGDNVERVLGHTAWLLEKPDSALDVKEREIKGVSNYSRRAHDCFILYIHILTGPDKLVQTLPSVFLVDHASIGWKCEESSRLSSVTRISRYTISRSQSLAFFCMYYCKHDPANVPLRQFLLLFSLNSVQEKSLDFFFLF
ncbi:hypothetical protein RclHR1_00190037 [Rhizophagus clarus]|uniref:Uncharacterized protein n=1 Tax=Rhizophagus clarus TaxID=94130 RepID=A0A2Z6R210_9GLOM|nr:hypothetical protein RclHR1_00190037 [Rhizophagus clarus]